MVRVPPENVKLVAYKETVQAFGSTQSVCLFNRKWAV